MCSGLGGVSGRCISYRACWRLVSWSLAAVVSPLLCWRVFCAPHSNCIWCIRYLQVFFGLGEPVADASCGVGERAGEVGVGQG